MFLIISVFTFQRFHRNDDHVLIITAFTIWYNMDAQLVPSRTYYFRVNPFFYIIRGRTGENSFRAVKNVPGENENE
jgi:hypothetical protein